MSHSELCGSSLPGLEVSAQDALLALGPWLQPMDADGRMPASSVSNQVVMLTSVERKYWRTWAETRLFDVQKSMDLTDSERRGALRKCLSSLANELVTFHGYATQGRPDRMERSLRRIEQLTLQSKLEGCP